MRSCARAIARYCRSRIAFESSRKRAMGPTHIDFTRRSSPISSSWTYRCPELAGGEPSATSGNGTAPRASWFSPCTRAPPMLPAILGSGEHRYRVAENWANLPEGWELADVASVAVDSKDRIYVFNRGAH